VSGDSLDGATRVDDTTDALEEMSRALTGEEPIEAALERLVQVVLKIVVDADAVSITVSPDNGPTPWRRRTNGRSRSTRTSTRWTTARVSKPPGGAKR